MSLAFPRRDGEGRGNAPRVTLISSFTRNQGAPGGSRRGAAAAPGGEGEALAPARGWGVHVPPAGGFLLPGGRWVPHAGPVRAAPLWGGAPGGGGRAHGHCEVGVTARAHRPLCTRVTGAGTDRRRQSPVPRSVHNFSLKAPEGGCAGEQLGGPCTPGDSGQGRPGPARGLSPGWGGRLPPGGRGGVRRWLPCAPRHAAAERGLLRDPHEWLFLYLNCSERGENSKHTGSCRACPARAVGRAPMFHSPVWAALGQQNNGRKIPVFTGGLRETACKQGRKLSTAISKPPP